LGEALKRNDSVTVLDLRCMNHSSISHIIDHYIYIYILIMMIMQLLTLVKMDSVQGI
jgi:hypothetical protein